MIKLHHEILSKITKKTNTDKLWDLVMEHWDLIDDEAPKREQRAKKAEILNEIHRLHNELFAIEQMLEEEV